MKSVIFFYLDCVDSTNNWAKRSAEKLDKQALTCIVAEEQTAGRGQFSKKWLSPRGENLYATLYFCVPYEATYTKYLGRLLCLSCALLLENQGIISKIKEPNDIFVDGKKCAGILTEIIQLEGGLGAVIGIGMNINMDKEGLSQIDQPATSLAMVSGNKWEIRPFAERLVKIFLTYLDVLEIEGWEALDPLYRARLIC